jgi:ankyrin repeat protein
MWWKILLVALSVQRIISAKKFPQKFFLRDLFDSTCFDGLVLLCLSPSPFDRYLLPKLLFAESLADIWTIRCNEIITLSSERRLFDSVCGFSLSALILPQGSDEECDHIHELQTQERAKLGDSRQHDHRCCKLLSFPHLSWSTGYSLSQGEFCISRVSNSKISINNCTESSTPFALHSRSSFLSPLILLAVIEDDLVSRMNTPQFHVFDSISRNDSTSLSSFLSSSPDVVHLLNWDEQTPLHLATRIGNLDMVRALLALGSDPDAPDRDGVTPFMEACRVGSLELMQELVALDVDLSAMSANGQTPLWFATLGGRLEAVRALVNDLGADPNIARADGVTPLMAACSQGHEAIASLLLAAGAEVNAKDPLDHSTALFNAAENGSADLVSILLLAGAHVDLFTSNLFTPLIVASAHGHLEVVRLLVLEANATVDLEHPDGVTPLMYASAAGHIDIVRFLLSVGALVNAAHSMGGTALLEAAAVAEGSTNMEETISTLIAAGAKTCVSDNEGVTPVIAASAVGNHRTVRSHLLPLTRR